MVWLWLSRPGGGGKTHDPVPSGTRPTERLGALQTPKLIWSRSVEPSTSIQLDVLALGAEAKAGV